MKAFQIRRQAWLAAAVGSVLAVLAPDAYSALRVTNGNFESGTLGDNVADWADPSDGTVWHGTWSTSDANISPNDSAIVVLGSYEDGATQSSSSTNVHVGNYLYQGIGTADGETSMELSFDWGAPDDDGGGRSLGLTVGIYAVDGFTAADNTDVRDAAGVTLLDSVSYQMSSTGTDGLISNVVVTLDLTGAGTQPLFLRFNNYRPSSTESWPVLDNVYLVNDLPPFEIKGYPSGTGVTNSVLLQAEIVDWGSEFDSVQMFFDGVAVTPEIDPNSPTTMVSYAAGSLDPLSVHTGKVIVAGINPDGMMTNEWTFTMANALNFISGSPSGPGGDVMPNLEVVIANALSELDTSSLELYLDGVAVAVDYADAFVPDAISTTVGGSWDGSALESGTSHTGMVIYAGINPVSGPFTNTWTFTTSGDPGYGIYIGDTNAPTPDAYDIYQFAYSTNDAGNINAGDDAAAYVAHDRPAQGQTFTTGSEESYELSSVWVKHVEGYETWSEFDLGDTHLLRITDPSKSGSADFVIYSETLTVITNAAGSMQGMPLTGTGYWIEYRLLNPVTLNGGTQYGFDLTTDSDVYGAFYELAGVNSNVYTGGTAYTSGTVKGYGGDALTTSWAGDHTFLIDLSLGSGGGGGGPTVEPNITLFSVSGGSTMLTWESETGVNYGVMKKTDLSSGSWTEVTNVAGAGASTSVTVPAESDREFFMIEGN